ncbi:Di-and tricarboxylate transporters [Mycoavidus cysteinexigens]|uniref:Di-and tricarboxylate transporters n=1 Tax=Mycoavidus cysteinexigens TaxID=1553431 RepID=A0A2Z6ESV7_9BURK|nr:Di-and tricarboxylate transporters [Mycoavidus cysteinexigens]GLR02246.1 hypothetical protein GCM10007934_20620 [Mycoavidus cysteinexigens]
MRMQGGGFVNDAHRAPAGAVDNANRLPTASSFAHKLHRLLSNLQYFLFLKKTLIPPSFTQFRGEPPDPDGIYVPKWKSISTTVRQEVPK